jgi:hypothetical protein
MNLKYVFDQLSHGELSTVALGGMNDDFGIREEDYEKICSHVNFALLDLSKKFQLNTKKVRTIQEEGVHTYVLDADLLSIISILDNEGNPYSLNRIDEKYIEEDEEEGDYNVSTDTTGFTYDYGVEGRTFIVHYQATLPRIEPIGLDPENEEINVHPGILQPLVYLVTSRVYASLPTLDGVNKGMEYLMKYEQACEVIQKYGLLHNVEFQNNRLKDNGWV